jgi:hypothetical protein
MSKLACNLGERETEYGALNPSRTGNPPESYRVADKRCGSRLSGDPGSVEKEHLPDVLP